MKRTQSALLAFILGTSAATQAATIVISQPTSTSLADYSPTGFGQSFTANGNYSITAINLYISSSAGGSDITLRLYDFDSLASTLGSIVRGSGVLLESSLSSTAAWETITLTTPVNVLSGATYAFTIIAKDPGESATGWNNYGVNSTDIYASGNCLSIGIDSSVSKQVSDLRFQVIAIPEPSSLRLFSVACTLTVTRRTRRSTRRRQAPCLVFRLPSRRG